MQLHYSVLWRDNAWRVLREDVEVAAHAEHESALLTAQHLASSLAGDRSLEVVVQTPSGEVRTLRVGEPGAYAHWRAGFD